LSKGFALITGASSGIGYEMAKILAAKGYPLIIVARRTDRLEELKKEIVTQYNIPIHIVTLDLSTKEAAYQLFDYTNSLQVDIEILINNAGFGLQCNFVNQPTNSISDMIQLNIITPTLLTRLFIPDLIRRGRGKILQVSSGSALLPTPYVSNYAATKSFIRYLNEALRFELQNQPITISTLYPGYTKSEFGEIAHAKVPWFIQYTQTSSRSVAEAGIKGMFKGKKSIYPGLFNKISLWSTSFIPRSLSVYLAGKVLGGKSSTGHTNFQD
jgi:short-subunit dehydrogenase